MTNIFVEESDGIITAINKFIMYLNEKTKRKHQLNERNMEIIDEEGFVIYDCCVNEDTSYLICAYSLLRRKRWEYIYLAATYGDHSNFSINFPPLLAFLNENNNITSKYTPQELRRLAMDLNTIIVFLENHYESYIIGGLGKVYIVLDTFSLKLRWSITEDCGWRFHFFTTKQDNYVSIDASKDNLLLDLKDALDHYIDKMELIFSFQAGANTFIQKYPSLSAYLKKFFGLLEYEYENFAKYIELKTAISPLELELEIYNSKDFTLAPQSIWVSQFTPSRSPDRYETYDFTTASGGQKRLYFGKSKDSIYQFVKSRNDK